MSFNRKKFGWLDENAFYKDMFTLGWKEVLQVRPAPAVPRPGKQNATHGHGHSARKPAKSNCISVAIVVQTLHLCRGIWIALTAPQSYNFAVHSRHRFGVVGLALIRRYWPVDESLPEVRAVGGP